MDSEFQFRSFLSAAIIFCVLAFLDQGSRPTLADPRTAASFVFASGCGHITVRFDGKN